METTNNLMNEEVFNVGELTSETSGVGKVFAAFAAGAGITALIFKAATTISKKKEQKRLATEAEVDIEDEDQE